MSALHGSSRNRNVFPFAEGGGNISQWCQPNIPRKIEDPEFSPDGSKLAFTVDGSCRVAVYSIQTESMVYLAPPKNSAVFGATFHPQGGSLAFILARQLGADVIDYQLAVSRLDGSGLKVLTTSNTRKRFPAYSQDGRKIVFEASELCRESSTQHCWADIYEFDLVTSRERRISRLQTTQVGPLSYMPSGNKIITSIYGDLHSDEKITTKLVASYGSEREIFIVDKTDPLRYEQLPVDTPTASSPKALQSGEVAFVSRVNEYEKIGGAYIYDVFLWRDGSTRRLTRFRRAFDDYAIDGTAQTVLMVSRPDDKKSLCELLLWNVNAGMGRKLKCNLSAEEIPLEP